jgi:hypothetical protein
MVWPAHGWRLHLRDKVLARLLELDEQATRSTTKPPSPPQIQKIPRHESAENGLLKYPDLPCVDCASVRGSMTIGIFVPFLVIEMTSFAVLMAFWQVDGII